MNLHIPSLSHPETRPWKRRDRPPLYRFLARFFIGAWILMFLLEPRVFSQMPDWVMVKDRDGNRFYMDRDGRLYVSGEPESRDKPVSAEGIDYFLHQGTELLKKGHRVHGLTLLKSIMALPPVNGRTTEAQGRASRAINEFMRKEGNRAADASDEAWLIFYRVGDEVSLIDEIMHLSILVRGTVVIVRRRHRSSGPYRYHGLLAGIRFAQSAAPAPGKQAYDALLAIDSENFAQPLSSASAFEHAFRKNLGPDSFTRLLTEKNEKRVTYSFADSREPYYSGLEGFFLSGTRGHCVRVISTKQIFESRKDEITAIMKSLKN
jgi:hypothetical protein